MSAIWIVVAATGAATIAMKGIGPALHGGRSLPPVLARVMAMLAPPVLAALVVTLVFGGDGRLVLDERVVGVLAAGLALALRAPLLAAVVVAAATAALVRLLA